MFLILIVLFAFVSADSRAPIPFVGMKRMTVHAVNTTAPEVGVANVVDFDHVFMKAFANGYFKSADVQEMRSTCMKSYALQFGFDFNPLNNPNAVCFPNGVCQIRRNGTAIHTMYPFKEENDFDMRLYLDTANPERGHGGWVQVVYSTVVFFNEAGVVQTPALQVGQRYLPWAAPTPGAPPQPVTSATCGKSIYWLKGSDPRGMTRGKPNIEIFDLTTNRLGGGVANAFGNFEYKLVVQVKDKDGNVGQYFDDQQVNFRWGEDGTGSPTRFGHDNFIFPLDTPLTPEQWVSHEDSD